MKLTPKHIGGVGVKGAKGRGLFGETDLRLTDSARDARPVNRRVMFVGENLAVRVDPEASHGAPYSMFHDLTLPTNTYKLYVQVNDRRLQGAYVTDAVKNTAESNSGHFELAFLVSANENQSLLTWRQQPKRAIAYLMKVRKEGQDTFQIAHSEAEATAILTANEETFRQSAAIFAQECHVMKPERLVTFGGGAANVLRQMKPLFADDSLTLGLVEQLVVATHYAYRNKGGFQAWTQTAQPELLAQLGLDQASSQPFD